MFIWRDDSGKPVSHTGSFHKEQWEAAVAEYEEKAAPAEEEAPKSRATRKATKED